MGKPFGLPLSTSLGAVSGSAERSPTKDHGGAPSARGVKASGLHQDTDKNSFPGLRLARATFAPGAPETMAAAWHNSPGAVKFFLEAQVVGYITDLKSQFGGRRVAYTKSPGHLIPAAMPGRRLCASEATPGTDYLLLS